MWLRRTRLSNISIVQNPIRFALPSQRETSPPAWHCSFSAISFQCLQADGVVVVLLISCFTCVSLRARKVLLMKSPYSCPPPKYTASHLYSLKKKGLIRTSRNKQKRVASRNVTTCNKRTSRTNKMIYCDGCSHKYSRQAACLYKGQSKISQLFV